MENAYSSKYYRLFIFCSVFVSLLDSRSHVAASSGFIVGRESDGDKFTNPHSSTKVQSCANIGAQCVDDLRDDCGVCKCNKGNETYRFDLARCSSSEELESYTGCTYKGVKDPRPGFFDTELASLDLSKKSAKNILAPINMPDAVGITCHIKNTSSSQNFQGQWVALTNIKDVLKLDVTEDHSGKIRRYLHLSWEGVQNNYSGLLVKLQIVCNTDDGLDSESNCFLLKTKGKHVGIKTERINGDSLPGNASAPPTTTKLPAGVNNQGTEQSFGKSAPTTAPTEEANSTKKSVVKNYKYSFPKYLIIAVAAGVGLVIVIIVILAVCFVRFRTRKMQKAKQAVNAEAPKVHFTAQTRFSLIRESAQVEPLDPDDYTCLKESREGYEPYCSLKKDDVDMNVIDQILKDAVSMESMEPSAEPRYSCRLSEDQSVVIESASPRPPKVHKYHVLEGPEGVNEPDYEEVDSSEEDEATVAARLLQTKPPVPEREYHVLEPQPASVYSEC